MYRKFTGTLLALALGGALLVPASGHAATPIPVIAVSPSNFMTAFPGHLSAGTVELQLTTTGKQDGTSVNLAQLSPGVSPARVRQLMHAGRPRPVLSILRLAGGVDSMAGTTQTGIFNLASGTYVVFSFDRLTDRRNPGSPTKFVTVSGANGAPIPTSAATYRAVDFKFRGPGTLPAGQDTIKFSNIGKAPHELQVVKIDANKTLADVKMALNQQNTPRWVRPVGGWGILSPGSSMWIRATLAPGTYVLLCFLPDRMSFPGHMATMKPHAMLGMIRLVHVG